MLRILTVELNEISTQLQFNATIDVAEYEALILGMQLALHLEARRSGSTQRLAVDGESI